MVMMMQRWWEVVLEDYRECLQHLLIIKEGLRGFVQFIGMKEVGLVMGHTKNGKMSDNKNKFEDRMILGLA